MAKRVSPFGSWKSPITSDLVGSRTAMMEPMLDGEDIYWRELKPEQGGRYTIFKLNKNGLMEMTPQPFNPRTLVHEYGGAAYVVRDGVVYFSNFADQLVYRATEKDIPVRVTSTLGVRFADGCFDEGRRRIIYVREDHTGAGRFPVNTIAGVQTNGDSAGQVLVSGNDFYSSPRLSLDGSKLAWLTWNFPNMPWDGTELWVGDLRADGSVGGTELIAGGLDEAVMQPSWSPDGVLHFVSDRTGWWNIYRWMNGQAEALTRMEAEFSVPHWVFGLSNYAFESSDRIFCTYTQNGTWNFAKLEIGLPKIDTIPSQYTHFDDVKAGPGKVVLIAGSPTEFEAMVQFDPNSSKFEVIHRSKAHGVDLGYVSKPQAITFPTTGGLEAHAFFYAPTNRDFTGPTGDLPPLIVVSHGGPTSSALTIFNPPIQFWTSRGFAVADVNYGGSTGYGRAYRMRLYDQWGVVDVDDCVNCAEFLAKERKADRNRLAIRGGSAGGYTTLCALTFRQVFKAGASYFGVSDLELLDKDTHKFESQYNAKLIGPYPEKRDLYHARSPIHFANQLSCPLIIFQGLEDKVVPPGQAEVLVKALREKKLPFAYITFPGEQHGFRKKENIKRAIEAELYFYSRVFGFTPGDPIEPVQIENLR